MTDRPLFAALRSASLSARAAVRRAAVRCGWSLLAGLALVSPAGFAQTVMLDSVVAIVEDDVIMSSELRARLDAVRANLTAAGQPLPPDELLVRETLDRLILDSIQVQRGERAGVRISDAQINLALNRLAAQRGMNLEQLRTQLQAGGESYENLREQVRREIIIQQIQQGSVNQRIQITDQEIDNYLQTDEGQSLMAEEYRLLHALFPVAEGAPPEEVAAVETYLEGLYEQIAAGEPFDEVISGGEYAYQGGDLGWRAREDLPSMFADIAPTLAPGETSRPIRSPSGFHLVRLADRRGGAMVVQQTLVRHILLRPSAVRSEEETQELAAELREQALAGADFGELAREYSDDIGSAAEGGDLGWTNPSQMVPAFENMMDSTALNDVSPPFSTRFGWHILQVLERRRQDVSQTILRNRAREILHQRKYQEELDAWLRKIRDEAFVDIK